MPFFNEVSGSGNLMRFFGRNNVRLRGKLFVNKSRFKKWMTNEPVMMIEQLFFCVSMEFPFSLGSLNLLFHSLQIECYGVGTLVLPKTRRKTHARLLKVEKEEWVKCGA